MGLTTLLAADQGAKCVAVDINTDAKTIMQTVCKKYFKYPLEFIFIVGSFLDKKTLSNITEQYPKYDIVHAWGVFHHTGEMWKAITQSAELVAPQGHLIFSLYNKHWSSKIWLYIKKTYLYSPRWLQKVWFFVFYWLILSAIFLRYRESPLKRHNHGFDYYYVIKDWLIGYPYEYASKNEVNARLTELGFELVDFFPAYYPTGCHEYVYRKK